MRKDLISLDPNLIGLMRNPLLQLDSNFNLPDSNNKEKSIRHRGRNSNGLRRVIQKLNLSMTPKSY